MQLGKKLHDYIGKNEKTKLIVKLQKVQYLIYHLQGKLLVDFKNLKRYSFYSKQIRSIAKHNGSNETCKRKEF